MPLLDETGLKRSLSGLWKDMKSYVDERPAGEQTAFLVKAPVGTIVIWSGTAADIPSGWQLCDGTNGTPDLRDKFVLGAGENHPVGETGGAEEVTLTISQMPRHGHAVRVFSNPNTTTGTAPARGNGDYTDNSAAVQPAGSGDPHPNMPPYHALCYIMKLAADETDGLPAFEEYDTEDGWHVRKWSDGYVEMTYSAHKILSIDVPHGTFYWSAEQPGVPYPVPLVKRYSLLMDTEGDADGSIVWVGTIEGHSAVVTSYTKLAGLPVYRVIRGTEMSDVGFTITAFVTGRWK